LTHEVISMLLYTGHKTLQRLWQTLGGQRPV